MSPPFQLRSKTLFLEKMPLFLLLFQVKSMMAGLVAKAMACEETSAYSWADVVGMSVKLLPPSDGNMEEVTDEKWKHDDVEIKTLMRIIWCVGHGITG